MDMTLKDRFGRVIRNLRVSVTDRCNLRCTYCMPPDTVDFRPSSEILSYEELARLASIFAGLGVDRIRVTGGEPTVRRDLHVLIRMLRAIDGVTNLSMTTNGVLLEEQARLLADAGLQRINVSLDTLAEATFNRLTFRKGLQKVLRGLEAVSRTAIRPIKINTVVMRGVNDAEIDDLVDFCSLHGFDIRFIEYMPIGAGRWSREDMVSGPEILERLRARFRLEPVPDPKRLGPAAVWTILSGGQPSGTVGFINSVTEPFCDECNRVRITADGQLRTCLFSTRETDLKSMLRGGAADGEIRAAVVAAVWEKEPGHKIGQADFVKPARSMSAIGG